MKNTLSLILIILSLFFSNIPKMENKNFSSEKDTILSKKENKIITTYGDSLTAGYGLPIEESYPSLLQKKLQKEGYPYKVINSGLSGDTTQAGLNRINWVLKTNPEIVILELGANDALRGMSVENAKKNLSSIIEKLQAKKIKILLAGMRAPRNLGEKYYKSFDNIYPELANKYKIPLIPFFLDGVAMDKNLNIGDGIHPNSKGYIKIVNNNVWKYLKPLISKN
ncbi:MAG: arylesterase [Candidatus Sericytochromatia bacterium]